MRRLATQEEEVEKEELNKLLRLQQEEKMEELRKVKLVSLSFLFVFLNIYSLCQKFVTVFWQKNVVVFLFCLLKI